MLSKKPFSQRIVIVLAAVCLSASAALAQTTEFSFQGRLTGVSPPSANYDLQLVLFETAAGGVAIVGQQRLNVAVASGSFIVNLDFGAGAFPGADRFMEVSYRRAGSGG